MTNRLDLFTEFKEFESPCSIKAAGKETLKALGKGTIQILSTTDKNSQKLTLRDVWYVPNISRNLFSVLAAQDKNETANSSPRLQDAGLKLKHYCVEVVK